MITIHTKKFTTSLFFLAVFLILHSNARASVTITKASGGTGISADNAANGTTPAYTTLGDLVITEGAVGDFSIGTNVTFRLSCPYGWNFNALASVSASETPGNDISSAVVTSVTTTLITVQLTISGITNSDALTISGIEVRANDGGNIPGSASIARGGTALITGCPASANLGSLSQTAGAVDKLVITLPGQVFSDANVAATSGNSGTAANQTAGTSFIITKIRACDQFYNVVASYSGMKTMVYSGPLNGLSAPSYKTLVSFASGVSSTVLTTTVRKAESCSISVSDGNTSGPSSSTFLVRAGPVANFLVESSSSGNIGSQVAGIPFAVMVTARDANNNSCTSGPNVFSGTATISSSGALTSGSGTTAAFSGGILSSHSLIISNQGNFTVTATKTGENQTGSSNVFSVIYPLSNLTSITPNCINTGDSSFTLTATGTNFNGTSVVRINGSDRNTAFIDSTTLDADILSADISSPGIFSIAVYTPGIGITSPLVLNINTNSTANVSICQGSSYTLPDGLVRNTAGTYVSHIPNEKGCDSAIVTNLVVDLFPARTQFVSICPGTGYTLPDSSTQNTPGTYISNKPNTSGCDSIITTNLSLLPTPVLTVTPVQISCFGNKGSVVLSPAGGAAPYAFGQQPTTNLVAGTYLYSMTDANGCSASNSATINPGPVQLTLSATPVQIACFGGAGSVNLVPSGGTPPYSYGATPDTLLTAGIYQYLVTDNNGCTAVKTVAINAAPSTLKAVTTTTNSPCGLSNGTASVNATGGSAPYSYAWNTVPPSSSNILSGLPIGSYTVTVTDNRGCTVSKTATVGLSNPMTLNITGEAGICPGANTTLCATTGFTSYSWSTGETTSCITASTADSISVVATDSLGCNWTKSVVTNNSPLPPCTITGGTLCLNGSLTLRAPTGYAGYLWSNGTRTSYNSIRSAGTYSVTVRSTAGCTSTCSYTVNNPMKITVSKTDGKCSNEYLGSATVTASNGIPPYTYLWSNGATTAITSRLAPGNYSIRVTDAGGCIAFKTISILLNKTSGDFSGQAMTFNSTPVDTATSIWFSAVANINYTGTDPVTIRFINQNIACSRFNVYPRNAKLIITNAVSQATTTFNGEEWVTTAPPNLSGNYFVSGYSYLVRTPIAASLSAVQWKGIWTASSSCVTEVNWKWSAAAYSSFPSNHTLIDVNPVDDATASPYANGNFAGTPENYTSNCMTGALSSDPTDYTGVYSPIVNRSPCVSLDSCNAMNSKLSGNSALKDDSQFFVKAYPNPFNAMANIDFQRMDKSGHMKIDVYNLMGERVRNIFDNDIEAGERYSVEFNAEELPNGIYFYRLVTEDFERGGKLILQR